MHMLWWPADSYTMNTWRTLFDWNRILVSSSIYQKTYQWRLHPSGSNGQGCQPLLIMLVDISASPQQAFHHVDVSMVCGHSQDGPAILKWFLRVSTKFDQRSRHHHVTAQDRSLQGTLVPGELGPAACRARSTATIKGDHPSASQSALCSGERRPLRYALPHMP